MRAWSIMQALRRHGFLQTLVIPVSEPGAAPETNGETARVELPDPAVAAGSWLMNAKGRALLQQVGAIPTRARLAAPAVGETILHTEGERAPHLVYVFRSYIAAAALPLMQHFRQTRFILDIDEADELVLAEMATLLEQDGESSRAQSLVREAELVKGFSRCVSTWYDACVASSTKETANLSKHQSNVWCLPNVVQIPEKPRRQSTSARRQVLFLGNLDYWPNQDALEQLLNHVFPALRTTVPDAELVVVGSGSNSIRVNSNASDGVHRLGFVDDLAGVYARCMATAIPLRAGGGTRIKVLESFAHGLPVIASAKAVEGLEVRHGEHLVITSSNEEMVRALREALECPERHRKRAEKAMALVINQYSQGAMNTRMDQLIEALLADQHGWTIVSPHDQLS